MPKSVNDDLIEDVIMDPTYDIRSDGTIWRCSKCKKDILKNTWKYHKPGEILLCKDCYESSHLAVIHDAGKVFCLCCGENFHEGQEVVLGFCRDCFAQYKEFKG